ncbi:MAG TPA: hypothetical protein VMA34_02455 [Terracidiphilus sp.]|nr:hypothetical protein [Terracidiphilus sp.]
MASRSAQTAMQVDAAEQRLPDDARWQVALRVAASELFARSEFLPKFLLHICELCLAGRTEEIKEQQIGVRVFHRPPSYNPGDDNIVRNYAVQLRKRLSLYFEGEGQSEPYSIEIPRGAYVPVFRARAANPPAPLPPVTAIPMTAISEDREAGELPAPSKQLVQGPARTVDWRMFVAGLAAGALVLTIAFWIWMPRLAATAQQPVRHPLWSAIFTRDRDTFIVPADAGLGILQNLTEEPASLTSYLNGEYFSSADLKGVDQGSLNDLRTQRYTSMVDLDITSRLSHLPEVVPDHLIVRYARDLRMDDLKSGNAILLGAIHTDPWVSLLQKGLNFQFDCGRRVNDCFIRNTHPARGEVAEYRSDPNSPSHETYALVALLPNLGGTGWILLIEGLNMAGTEAGANILLDDATMRPLIQKFVWKNDSLRSFELLIKTGSLGAEALPAQIIASRFGGSLVKSQP